MTLGVRALVATLAIQAYVSLAAVAVSVLAPEISRDAGIPAEALGVFVGVLYAGSMFSGLLSGGFIDRYGPIRVSQIATLVAATGLAAATGPLPLLAAASVVMGLGYGPITPASSQILVRTTPPERMALTFSLKQTGVPLGAALAGALLPGLAAAIGWRAALWGTALAGIAVALSAQAIRSALDVGLHPDRRVSVGGVLGPLRLYLSSRDLRELGRTGFAYALSQSCLVSFLVVFLSAEAGLSLIAAGFALTLLNLAAVAGRVAWGVAADRWVPPRRVLGALGVTSGACGFAMTTIDAQWPHAFILALCAVYGAVAVGWNGVQLSEVARSAPEGKVGVIAGAASFVTFAGVLIGPPVFGALAAATGSYRSGFAMTGLTSLAVGVALLRRHRGARRVAESPPAAQPGAGSAVDAVRASGGSSRSDPLRKNEN